MLVCLIIIVKCYIPLWSTIFGQYTYCVLLHWFIVFNATFNKCTKPGVNLKIRYNEVMAALKDSTESLSTAV